MPTGTAVLDAYSKAYPFISNRIRASIRFSSSPLSIYASIIDTTVGHPQRVYHFPGLPRNNYDFSLDEIDGAGAVLNNLALFSVVPSTISDFLTRNDEQIQVDTTLGFASGTTSFTFDGTAGKPDYTGWDIVPSELTGRGILVEGVDYSWDKTLGEFNLLIVGDIFQTATWYNIHFEPYTNTAGNSTPNANNDFLATLVTSDYSILANDFSNKLIFEPTTGYLEATLPDIRTIPQGRKIMLEGSGSGCTKIKPFASDTIEFLFGSLYLLPDESISVYKFTRGSVDEWRCFEASGNFASCGRLVSEDRDAAITVNARLLDGSSIDKFLNARLYNEVVLRLPLIQVCNYDDWATGDNKYLYSLANSSNPAFANKFKIPDRRGLFERNNSIGKAGDYQTDEAKFSYDYTSGTPLTAGSPTGLGYSSGNPAVFQFRYTTRNIGTETRPKNYLTNKYVLL